mgnify:CR=1 FL=1
MTDATWKSTTTEGPLVFASDPQFALQISTDAKVTLSVSADGQRITLREGLSIEDARAEIMRSDFGTWRPVAIALLRLYELERKP